MLYYVDVYRPEGRLAKGRKLENNVVQNMTKLIAPRLSVQALCLRSIWHSKISAITAITQTYLHLAHLVNKQLVLGLVTHIT